MLIPYLVEFLIFIKKRLL